MFSKIQFTTIAGWLVVFYCLGAPIPAKAADPHGIVQRLGELNGIALYCKHSQQVRDIKIAMVRFTPKLAEYRDTFFAATNSGFIEQSRNQQGCQELTVTKAAISTAIDKLETQFQTPSK